MISASSKIIILSISRVSFNVTLPDDIHWSEVGARDCWICMPARNIRRSRLQLLLPNAKSSQWCREVCLNQWRKGMTQIFALNFVAIRGLDNVIKVTKFAVLQQSFFIALHYRHYSHYYQPIGRKCNTYGKLHWALHCAPSRSSRGTAAHKSN